MDRRAFLALRAPAGALFPRHPGWRFLPPTLFSVLLLIGAFLALTGIRQAVTPIMGTATYQFEGRDPQTADMPFYIPAASPILRVTVPVTAWQLSSTRFALRPDDCIDAFLVNGRPVPDAAGFCYSGTEKVVDVAALLRSGTNTFQLTIRDTGGNAGLNLQPTSTGPFLLTLRILSLLVLIAAIVLILRSAGLARLSWLHVVLLAGIALRVLYVQGTPYQIRGHDTDAHIEYIRYIAAHWSVPPAHEGWEYHQPPLYYALSAGWWTFAQWTGYSDKQILLSLQGFSLLASIIALLCAFWMCRLLFPRSADEPDSALALAVVAFFPGLVFASSRITNDVLAHALAFLCLALLLRWWLRKDEWTWLLISVVLGLGVITKVSIFLLFPVAGAALLLARGIGIWKKIQWGVFCAIIIALIAGWYAAWRLTEADITKTVTLGNMGMSSGLAVATTPENFATFHPLALLKTPFNHPWEDSARRQFFWEYFFRSAFFGEFSFPQWRSLASFLLFFAMGLLPLVAWGLIADFRDGWRRHLPLWAAFLCLLAGALAYRLRFAYAPNQDFRFSTLLTVPIAFYLVWGLRSLPALYRSLARGWVVIFLACAALFLFLVSTGTTSI